MKRGASPTQPLSPGRRSRRIAWELGSCDQAVRAALGQQFAVAAALDDPAVIDDADLVGLSDGRAGDGR